MTEYITVTEASPASRSGAIKLHDAAGFEGMRRAGHLAAEVLDALVPHVVPGVTTEELDDLVREHMLRGGGVPATLGYRGYTHSRSEEHPSELPSLMRTSYAVFCLKKKKTKQIRKKDTDTH